MLIKLNTRAESSASCSSSDSPLISDNEENNQNKKNNALQNYGSLQKPNTLTLSLVLLQLYAPSKKVWFQEETDYCYPQGPLDLLLPM